MGVALDLVVTMVTVFFLLVVVSARVFMYFINFVFVCYRTSLITRPCATLSQPRFVLGKYEKRTKDSAMQGIRLNTINIALESV